MRFTETPICGLFVLELERHEDERGYFARAFCADEFARMGFDGSVAQCNTSYNKRAGTLRGLHYQIAPSAEDKLVRCTAGEVLDVAVDFREGSPTFARWHGVLLSAENGLALLVPKGFAHGYLTLADDSSVFYIVSAAYSPQCERGLNYADPRVGIVWPAPGPRIISERDKGLPCL